MDRQPILEGDRLRLRPLVEADWGALFALASDPQIWAGHPSHDRWQEPVFRAFFDEALAGGGALAIIDKASNALIGSSRYGEMDTRMPVRSRSDGRSWRGHIGAAAIMPSSSA